jgi:thiamine kinase-like enzyme
VRRWPVVIELCRELPETLVHGDLTEKNLRTKSVVGHRELLALDWELAGFGFAAVDVVRVDPALYSAAVQDTWPAIDTAAVSRAAVGGRLLRLVLALSWAARRLPYSSIERPLAQMQSYVSWLDDDLAKVGAL